MTSYKKSAKTAAASPNSAVAPATLVAALPGNEAPALGPGRLGLPVLAPPPVLLVELVLRTKFAQFKRVAF